MPIATTNDDWTDARVDTLKGLWASGLSSSQIAAQLGGGLSRSAVIGKIHRLKLPVPAGKAARAPRSPIRVITKPKVSALTGPATFSEQRRNPSNNLAAKLAIAETEPGLPPLLRGEAPDGTGIKLIELRPDSCRWPKGDPLQENFEFCGCKSLPDLPYCAHHTRRSLRVNTPRGVQHA